MLSEALSVIHSTPLGNLLNEEKHLQVFGKNALLGDVWEHFIESLSDTVIFVEEAMAVGIMTLKDMLRLLSDETNLLRPAGEFMSAPVHLLDSTASISEAIEKLYGASFDKIVVSMGDGTFAAIDRDSLHSFCYHQILPMIPFQQTMFQSLSGLIEEGENGLLKLATTDTLTGLGNRRLLESMFQSHQEFDATPFGILPYLIMFDIDDFKTINDTFGHPAGDLVLKEMARLVKASIRKSDTLIRWGGEEFIILLYCNDANTPLQVAEHLRDTINRHSFEKIIHVTCSFGLTAVRGQESLSDVIERADRALYRAKDEGKNCVRIENV